MRLYIYYYPLVPTFYEKEKLRHDTQVYTQRCGSGVPNLNYSIDDLCKISDFSILVFYTRIYTYG